MSTLKVSVAYDEARRLVFPEAAHKGGSYFCPACDERLVLKRGTRKVPHFAHTGSQQCSPEMIVRRAAQMELHRTLEEWLAGRAAGPVIERACFLCERHGEQSVPDKLTGVVLDYSLPSGERLDVALMVGPEVGAAIQIVAAAQVDKEKESSLPLAYIEVDGQAIVANPARWKPLRDRFKTVRCGRCRQDYARFRVRCEKLARQTGISLPQADYRYAPAFCWRCKREILVFTWANHSSFAKKLPATPPPKSLHYRYSKTVRDKYWANTCPYCRAIQGDWFLHN